MKHITMLGNEYDRELEARVKRWIEEHNDEVIEIINIEYAQYGSMYSATVTYEERK